LCLILGPLGVYFFLNYVFRREKEGLVTNLAAFLGAMAYLLNLATLQHFFLPFEMFTTQYAFLPWLFLFALKFLREKRKKYLLAFAVLTIISGPQAYAATLFYAYFGALIIFVLAYRFKRGLVLILVCLLLNLYWLLPNAYSIVRQSETVINSRINRLFSPEAEIRSLDFSDVSDVLIHKSFLFDWRVFDFQNNKFTNLMEAWNNYLSQKYVILILYTISSFSILGLIWGLVKRDKVVFSLSLVFLYSLFFLTGSHYINNSLLRETLRMPFTKFSIIFLFAMSFFFGYIFFKLFRRAWLGTALTLIVSGGLIFSVWPMFQGKLVSSVVKTDVPTEYFELFNWFKDKPGRIASLPLNTLWGWDYHSWKYEGSGFLTYGLPNPLLVRDFDRWSPYNETFYAESSTRLYANDNESFERTLRKYQVKYLLLDGSIINPGGSENISFNISNNIKEVQKFGFLTVYETNFDSGDNFISTPPSYISVNADLTYSQIDPVYQKYGDYIEDENGVGYPFVNFDPRGPVSITSNSSDLIFENKAANSKVTLPIKDKIVESFGEDRGFKEANNCDLKKLGRVEKDGKTYRAFGGGVACDFFEYPDLKYSQAYVLRIKGENKKGRGLKIYLQNWETGRMDLEELLPTGKFDNYFVILPKLSDKGGYTLNLETRSFGRIASENRIDAIEIYPFDFNLLVSLLQNPEREITISNNLRVENVKKFGTAFYKVQTSGNGLLVLGQGYEKGWLAFKRKVLLKHVKVDSWSNGWIVLPNQPVNQSTIYLIFWPQALEWFGFIILVYMLTGLKGRVY
ncbi:MAG: hypothetical protein NTV24_04170, partial [Candidatus Woesebacteria bacterium]|nr:hypothetical protein [Candidatus Woesebacteria bacterium]